MPENEFEKKVSSEMQDLRLKPSANVWLHVEERIRKKKKRRVLVIFFFLAGIALLGYWQRNNLFSSNDTKIVKTDTDPNQDTRDALKENNTEDNKKEISPSVQIPTTPENKNLAPDNKVPGKTENKIAVSPKRTSERKTDKTTAKNTPAVSKDRANNPVEEKKQTNEASALIVTQTDAGVKTKEEKDSVEVKVEGAEIRKEDIKVPAITPIENKNDSTKNEGPVIKKDEVVKNDTAFAKAPVQDSAIAIIPQARFDKKWRLGIELTPGISSLHEEIFSLNMNKSLADSYGGPQSGSGSGAPLPPSPPSESVSSFAFQIGGFAKKQLSRKSSLTMGLRYAYYSESIEIGAGNVPLSGNLSVYLNSQGANQAFSVAGNPIPVTNRYHFIELPVNYGLQLNRNKSYPLLWQVGFKIGKMIGNNALVYDTIAGGIYYESKKYFNQTQFGLSTNLNWTFVDKNRFQVGAGPVVNLHLNSLQDAPFEKNKYLFFIGLRSTIIFNNKK